MKKIVEEFYHDAARLKNINQSIVIKYRTNYSVMTINCSAWIRSGFFILFHPSPMRGEFCKLQCFVKVQNGWSYANFFDNSDSPSIVE